MAGGLDAVGRSVSLSLITDFGTSVLFTRVTNPGSFDVTDGSVTGRTTEDQTVVALPTKPDQAYMDGDVTDSDEVVILVPASAITWVPEPGTIAEFDGRKYTATGVETVKPGILPILYKVRCIRGTEKT